MKGGDRELKRREGVNKWQDEKRRRWREGKKTRGGDLMKEKMKKHLCKRKGKK